MIVVPANSSGTSGSMSDRQKVRPTNSRQAIARSRAANWSVEKRRLGSSAA